MDGSLRPYSDLVVLDAGQGVAGPYCGMLLAATGAEVIKLEPPEGDWSRGLGTRQGTQSVISATYNRGKRSVVLDLRDPSLRDDLAALVARADIVIESFRPGVAARLGLGPENTRGDAVYLSISGFGQHGPYAARPCTDSVAQAYSGLVAMNRGEDGVPHRVPLLVSDVTTGLHGFIAVQAALAERARDVAAGQPPRRRVLDLSLIGATAALLALPIAEAGLCGGSPAPINVPAGCYECADGAWVAFTLVRDAQFVSLCDVIGRPDLPNDPRFASFAARAEHRDALLPLLRALFRERPAAAWREALIAAGLLCEKVNTPLDWLADPHVEANGLAPLTEQPGLGTLPFPVLPGLGATLGPAPALGEHTEEILAALR